jgi:hypothetical protein
MLRGLFFLLGHRSLLSSTDIRTWTAADYTYATTEGNLEI